MVAETKNNWPISYWATFKPMAFHWLQCEERLSRATTIVYWQMLKKKVRDEHGVEQEKTIPLLKTWSIFNASQVEGDAVSKLFAMPELKSFDVDHSEFESVVAATQARIEHGHDMQLTSQPKIELSCLMLIALILGRTMRQLNYTRWQHWTQPAHRLNISEGYAADELFAEIASSYLMAELGIPPLSDECATLRHTFRAGHRN